MIFTKGNRTKVFIPLSELDLTEEESSAIKEQIQNDTPCEDVQNLQKQAEQMSEEYNKQIEEQAQGGELDPLAAITPKEMYYPINEHYKDVVAEMNLPIFYAKTIASIQLIK